MKPIRNASTARKIERDQRRQAKKAARTRRRLAKRKVTMK
jgi:hypothetical protein